MAGSKLPLLSSCARLLASQLTGRSDFFYCFIETKLANICDFCMHVKQIGVGVQSTVKWRFSTEIPYAYLPKLDVF